MPRTPPPIRVFRVHQHADGRFETRNEHPADDPLGIDHDLERAIGTAVREAMRASQGGCRVAIEVQQSDGTWKFETLVAAKKRL